MLLMFALAVVLAQASPAPEPDPALQSILAQLGTNDSDSLIAVNAYIKTHPDDGDGYAVRCTVRLRMAERSNGDWSQGLDDCTTALQMSPKSAFSHLLYADALYDNNKVQDSLAEYSTAISLGETGYGIFSKRCDAERRTGDLSEAIADCAHQVRLNPDSPYAHYALGIAQFRAKTYDDAITNLTYAVDRSFNLVDSLYWRGLCYSETHRFAEAEADFTRGISLGDKTPDTLFQRGQARIKLNKIPEAIGDLVLARAAYQAQNNTNGVKAVDDLRATLTTPATGGNQR